MSPEKTGINFIIIFILMLLSISAYIVNTFSRDPETDERGCIYDAKSFYSNSGSNLTMQLGYVPCFFISPKVSISFLKPVETSGSNLRISVNNKKNEWLAVSQLYNNPIIICLPFISPCWVYGIINNSKYYSKNLHLLTEDPGVFKEKYSSLPKKTVKIIYNENTTSFSEDPYERDRFIIGYPSNHFDLIKSYDLYKYFKEIDINSFDFMLIILYYTGQLLYILAILTLLYSVAIIFFRNSYIFYSSILLLIFIELYISLLFFVDNNHSFYAIRISCILVNMISFICGYNVYLIKKKLIP